MKLRASLFLFLAILVLLCKPCFAQQDIHADPQLSRFNFTTQDLDSLYEYSTRFSRSDFHKGYRYAQHAMRLSERLHYPQGKTLAWIAMGVAHRFQGTIDSAIYYYGQGLALARQLHYNRGIINSLHGTGLAYFNRGDYEKALNQYLQAIKVAEDTNDRRQIAGLLNSIALVYNQQGNYKQAIDYYRQSLKLRHQLKDRKGESIVLNNLAHSYYLSKDTLQSQQLHQQSLQITRELGDLSGIALSLASIGEIKLYRGDYKQARHLLDSALRIRLQLKDKLGLIIVYRNLGILSQKKRNFEDALANYGEALAIAHQVEAKDDVKKLYRLIAQVYSTVGNFREAAEYYHLYAELAEKLFTETNAKKIAEMQAKYESARQEKEISILNKDRELKDVELSRQKTFRNSLFGGGLLLLVLIVVLLVSYKEKHRANQQMLMKNQELEHQKEEISAQHEEIELQKREMERAYEEMKKASLLVANKNEEINDSIRYARRLQNAILPPLQDIRAVFPESFVFFRPREVVSGDFYYFAQQQNRVVISAIDCTGHGIPGAFMSMIGYEVLNQIVHTDTVLEPAHILEQMHRAIVKTLRQGKENSESDDGMDMVLCSIDLEKRELQMAGAHNPLFIFNPHRPESFIEIKGDKRAIGGKYGKTACFTNHIIQLQQHDTVYFFSDGYADQFGGPQNKKYMVKRFRQLLASMQPLTMQQQYHLLDSELREWRGSNDQIDDILVIGIRFDFS